MMRLAKILSEYIQSNLIKFIKELEYLTEKQKKEILEKLEENFPTIEKYVKELEGLSEKQKKELLKKIEEDLQTYA